MTAFYNFIHFLSGCSLLFSIEKPPWGILTKYVCMYVHFAILTLKKYDLLV